MHACYCTGTCALPATRTPLRRTASAKAELRRSIAASLCAPACEVLLLCMSWWWCAVLLLRYAIASSRMDQPVRGGVAHQLCHDIVLQQACHIACLIHPRCQVAKTCSSTSVGKSPLPRPWPSCQGCCPPDRSAAGGGPYAPHRPT